MKWYETEGQRGDYDWGDMTLPFLDVKDADVFESPSFMQHKYGDTNHISALVLLKMKVLVDVLRIRLCRKVLAAKAIPPELWIGVELAAIRSPLSAKLTQQSSVELAGTEGKLLKHVKVLGALLRETNDNMAMGLLNPDEWLTSIPEAYSSGSVEEMQLVLQHSFTAWWQTEGVLELLQDAMKNAGKDSEDEMEDMMSSSTFNSNPGASRTKAELLRAVSINRIWGYLDWAVEDAGSLSAERPSDAHVRDLRAMLAEEDDSFTDEVDDWHSLEWPR